MYSPPTPRRDARTPGGLDAPGPCCYLPVGRRDERSDLTRVVISMPPRATHRRHHREAPGGAGDRGSADLREGVRGGVGAGHRRCAAGSPRPGSTTTSAARRSCSRDHELRDGHLRGARPAAGAAIADPVERLKACMEKNIFLVTEGWSKEVTIILHEHETLTGAARRRRSTPARNATSTSSSLRSRRRCGKGRIRRSSDGGGVRVSRPGALDLQVVPARRQAHRRRARRGHGGSAVHRPRAALLTPFTKSGPARCRLRGAGVQHVRSLAPGGRSGPVPQLEGRIARMKTSVGIEALAAGAASPNAASGRSGARPGRGPGQVHRRPRRTRDGGHRPGGGFGGPRRHRRSPMIDGNAIDPAHRDARRWDRDRRGPRQSARSFVQGAVGLPRPCASSTCSTRVTAAPPALMAATEWIASGRPAGVGARRSVRTSRGTASTRRRAHAGRRRGGDAGLRPSGPLCVRPRTQRLLQRGCLRLLAPVGSPRSAGRRPLLDRVLPGRAVRRVPRWREGGGPGDRPPGVPRSRANSWRASRYHVPFCKMAKKAHATSDNAIWTTCSGAFDEAAKAQGKTPRASSARWPLADPVLTCWQHVHGLALLRVRENPPAAGRKSSPASASDSSATAAAAPASSSRASLARTPPSASSGHGCRHARRRRDCSSQRRRSRLPGRYD